MYSIDKYNELHINMTSRRYKSVSNRQQISLLPPSIEDYVQETNPVRVIDAYVNTLDLAKQGFQTSSGGVCAGNMKTLLNVIPVACRFLLPIPKSGTL